MQGFYKAICEQLASGQSVCLATIVAQRGSAPRSSGSSFFVRADGEFHGTIGGGGFEAQVIEQARTALGEERAELMRYRLEGKDVADSEMICGGNVDVYLEPVLAVDPLAAQMYQTAQNLLARGVPALLATLMQPGGVNGVMGRKMLLSADGESLGGLEGGEALRGELTGRLGRLSAGDAMSVETGLPGLEGALGLLVEPIISQPVVYVFGGGHVSQQLAPLIKMVGFKLVVADDRVEWANAWRFPQADEIWNQDLDLVLDGKELGPEAYIVIVTRGHIFDKVVLAQALQQNASYVGMIGSRRKRDMIFKALVNEGFSREQIASVHSPIGLAIGAETPEEIAISIVAELVAVRAGLAEGGGKKGRVLL